MAVPYHSCGLPSSQVVCVQQVVATLQRLDAASHSERFTSGDDTHVCTACTPALIRQMRPQEPGDTPRHSYTLTDTTSTIRIYPPWPYYA